VTWWFANYRARLLKRIYQGTPYSGSTKLDALWPLILGGAAFMALDLGLGLRDPVRLGILAALLMPGVIWASCVTFHDLNALRLWLKRRGKERQE
jgi:hypothetical protein